MSSNGASHSRDDPESMEIPLEFPTTNLYELEDRVFVDNWSIPYKREESLGKCLQSAARFAQDGEWVGSSLNGRRRNYSHSFIVSLLLSCANFLLCV